MKKIYTYILLSVVALAAIHTEASAQTDPTDAIKLTKTISPKKDAHGNIDPSQFILRLESYVTGSSVETVSEIVNPVDLVLVLDTSTSMDNSSSYVDGTSKYTARSSQGYSYDGYGSKSYYYLFSVGDGADGQYHEVFRGFYGNSTKRYYLYFTVGDETYYLSGNAPTKTRPSDITKSNSTIWTGVLYTHSQKKRLEVLQEAVNAFIDTVKVKSYGPDGVAGGGDDIDHRIAIVTFNQREYYETGAQGHSESDSNYGDNLLSVTSSQNITKLKTVVSGLTTKNYTRQDRGILAANNILGAIPESRDTTSKVIVVFTDGAPYPGGVNLDDGVGTQNNNTNKANIRNNGVTYSHVSKDTYGASVFTVTLGELDGDDAKFMEYMSSNYPDAENFSTPGTKKSNDYNFVSKGGLGLSEIFAGIAKSSTQGGESYQLDHTATSVVDVVTDNFIIPSGVKDEDVELSVECYWVDGDGNEHWVPESDTAHGGYHYSDDRTPSASIDHDTNKLTVSGFDFTKADEWGEDGEIDVKGNWVGVRELADGTKLYWGKKIVIEFPIQVNPDYEGGYDMPSNDITSGIYTKDKDGNDVFVKAYPVPSTDFPSICIMKEGLNIGETALFDVTGPDVNYTISLTQKADSLGYKLPCFVVLKRLDGGEYTVTEKNWTWMYDVTPASKTISQKVVSAEYLRVNVESIFESGSDLENNGTVVGMQKEVSGTDPELGAYTGTFCVLKEKDGEYAVDDLKGSAISLLYYFTNKRNTEGKPARAEAYAHNVFAGGKTQGGTESGGYEEESYD